jgi:hypothetical protein
MLSGGFEGLADAELGFDAGDAIVNVDDLPVRVSNLRSKLLKRPSRLLNLAFTAFH